MADLPPIGEAGYLFEMATRAGMYELKWQELASWMQATSTTLTPWEAEAIKLIASAYTGAVMEYRDKPKPAPYQPKKLAEMSVKAAIRGRRVNRD